MAGNSSKKEEAVQFQNYYKGKEIEEDIKKKCFEAEEAYKMRKGMKKMKKQRTRTYFSYLIYNFPKFFFLIRSKTHFKFVFNNSVHLRTKY